MGNISSRTAHCLVGASIVLTSCAQLLFRYVMQQFSIAGVLADGQISILPGSLAVVNFWMLALGIALYASSMLVWIFALTSLDISFAYPLLSMSYVLVYAGAVYLPALDETASPAKLAGTVIMVLGVFVLSCRERPARGHRARE